MSVRDVVQAAAGALGGDKVYVEDVFSTYLYTGNGTSQTITNGIDLDGEGGLVWTKSRSGAYSSGVYDTERGATKELKTDATTAQSTDNGVTAFSSTGYSIGARFTTNNSGDTYASWTFRKAPKFFDVVTWTGDGVNGRELSHNLGSVPGCIIIKNTSTSGYDWITHHVGNGSDWWTKRLYLNNTSAVANDFNSFHTAEPTATSLFLKGTSSVNASGETYVAYLFAHDAGGFGDDGEQNVISCGSYTGTGSNLSVDLGFEPQFVLIKKSSATSNWWILDTMRGFGHGGVNLLYPHLSDAEYPLSGSAWLYPTATGFFAEGAGFNESGNTYIYIAIRRPMKTPESGTEVFAPVLQDFDGFVNTGFVTDLIFGDQFTGGNNWRWLDRLRGETKYLSSNNTSAEGSASYWKFDYNTGVALTYGGTLSNWMWYNFRRAPGFFDVVAYTGDGSSNRTLNHNLGVAPEMMIVKRRNGTSSWSVYHQDLAAPAATRVIFLSTTGAYDTSNFYWNSTAPTSTVFTLSASGDVNGTADTYIAYLFATLAGVSKVGSYTGTAADIDVDCGFSAGARFVLIKRTDSTGDWYVWDSARGIIAGNDPYLLLNSTAAEVTNTDYIDPLSSGFTVTSSAPAALNDSGGSYIFLAIA